MFTLIQLPYALDALEPVISKQTLEYHYGKHLQAYVDNLNKLLKGSEHEDKTLEEIIYRAKGGIFNNAGQVLNHELYFTQFKTPDQIKSYEERSLLAPTGNLFSQIKLQWESLEKFQLEFELAGGTLFGSGWVWLQADYRGKLSIEKYSNADNPVAHDYKPILTFDVWEHAYYLDYQNRRPTYLHELWKIVDWNVLEERYAK